MARGHDPVAQRQVLEAIGLQKGITGHARLLNGYAQAMRKMFMCVK